MPTRQQKKLYWPRRQKYLTNPKTFLFLVGDTLRHRRIGPSSLEEILVAYLVQTEYRSRPCNDVAGLPVL